MWWGNITRDFLENVETRPCGGKHNHQFTRRSRSKNNRWET